MAYSLKLFGIMLATFLLLDFVWLGFIAKGWYQKYLAHLLAADINWYAAGIFYVLFIVGLLVFVVEPGLKDATVVTTLWKGALFGLIAYATFDLTCQAMFKDWPVFITVVDLIWGMFLSAAVSTVGYFAGKWLLG